jgi:hypothetical protein
MARSINDDKDQEIHDLKEIIHSLELKLAEAEQSKTEEPALHIPDVSGSAEQLTTEMMCEHEYYNTYFVIASY